MKRIILIVSLITWSLLGNAQISQNQSDGNTPLVPIPFDLKTPETTCADNLLSFYLPCSSNEKVIVKNVAKLRFTGSCKHEVMFDPPVIDIPTVFALANKSVTVNYNGTRLFATIIMVNSDVVTKDPALAARIENGLSSNIENWRKDVFRQVLANIFNQDIAKSTFTETKPQIAIDASVGNNSCPFNKENCFSLSTKLIGKASWSNGFNGHFSVYGIPYRSTLDVDFKTSLDAIIDINNQTKCDDNDICQSFNFNAGIDSKIINYKDGIHSNLKMVADNLEVQGKICLFPLPVTNCSTVKMDRLRINGTVESQWGLMVNKVDYVVFDGYSSASVCY